jgi:hypothetical protein
LLFHSDTREKTLRDPLRHLPFALVAFIVLLMGFVDWGVRVPASALVTLLAPMLWLGLYVLFGADHAASE